MALTNQEIADIFNNIADMLEIQGENRFKFLSYRRAGETLGELPRDLQAYVDDGTLTDIPGIGKAISDKIKELLETDKLEFYEKLRVQVPESLLEIKRINGVGPKKAKLFWDELNITTVAELKLAATENKLRDLSGMGAKSEQKIIDSIEALSRNRGRTPIGNAKQAADTILAELVALPQVEEAMIAGSIRRGKTTIGDVDILAVSDDAEPIMAHFVGMGRVERILGQGPTKSSIELRTGLQVDLRVLPRERFGTALQYFTGSKDHNVRIREIALNKGYSLNEHALRPIDNAGNMLDESHYVYCGTEEDVYEKIGLPWIAPELREDQGEIEAAIAGKLPNLITAEDILSDLHMHTTWSDGTLSIREMAEAARERGKTHIVITDHSKRSIVANGLDGERLLQQQAEVRTVNEEMGDNFHVLHGVEMDVLEDGNMDLPDDILAQLDFVVASLHFGLTQDRAAITKRLLNAINNPHVDCIGHMTGRLIGSRPSAYVDFDTVFEAALETDTVLEINANPARLDLDAQYARRAHQLGIKLAINTDAHSIKMMDMLPYGILTARRAWAEPENVINTWTFDRFYAWIQSRA